MPIKNQLAILQLNSEALKLNHQSMKIPFLPPQYPTILPEHWHSSESLSPWDQKQGEKCHQSKWFLQNEFPRTVGWFILLLDL